MSCRLHCRPFVVILNRDYFRKVQGVLIAVYRLKLMQTGQPSRHDHPGESGHVGVVRIALARYGVSVSGFSGEPESLSTSGPKKPRLSFTASMRSLNKVVTSRI